MLLEELRQTICALHAELPRNNLVVWTGGNISGRDPSTNLVVIKPSGLLYPDLTPENMVVLNLAGQVAEGSLKPSSDTLTHLYIYRQRMDINGIVHTHSPFATAFAAVGKPIPPVLTAICDEFGGEIPVGGFAPIGDEAIGQEVVRSIGNCTAILMQNHGVFTIGKNPQAAVKSAIMVESAAQTVYFAMQLGDLLPISPTMVEQLHKRYQEQYGQKPE